MLIDTHAHLNFKAYDPDRADVIDRVIAADMKVINPASRLDNGQLAVDLAAKHPGRLYAAVGFHPIHLADTVYDYSAIKSFIRDHRSHLVAIGEIGLDYFRLPDGANRAEVIARQKEIFTEQYRLAIEQDLPVIVHCRDAYEDLLSELERIGPVHRGVIHCWLGTLALAQRFLKLGFHLGFTGIITFTKDEALLDVARTVPLDKLLIETDAPYLAPVPQRGKRNEPIFVKYVAGKVAELRQMSIDDIIQVTGENAIKLFKL